MRPVQMMGISKHNTECQRQSVDGSIAREPSMPSRPTRNSVCPLHIHLTAHPGLPRGLNVITKVLLSEQWREESQRELGDAVLLAWKVEEGASYFLRWEQFTNSLSHDKDSLKVLKSRKYFELCFLF